MSGTHAGRARRRGLLGLLLLVACGGEPEPPAPAGGTPRNLVLVSLDTLRADRLGAYGYDRPTSPTLDALARRGVRFETVIAESNWTLPSHVTLMTGLAPREHGVVGPGRRLVGSVQTLPEVLRALGFRTAGFTGGGFLGRRYGFDRGFDVFRDESLPFAAALELAAREIQGIPRDERFFVFLHTFEVHCPYDPPDNFAEAFDRQPESDHLETEGRCGNPHYNEMDLTAGQVAFLSDRYDAGIRYADELLRRFLDWLAETGRASETLLVVVSDHGEELHEHGQIGHVGTLYMESLRVPWIMAGPGVEPGVVTRAVGLAEVMPSVLALLGVGASADAALARGEADPEAPPAPRFSHCDWQARLRSMVLGDLHLIYRMQSREMSLFDWRADPAETHDLAGRDPARDRELLATLYGQLVQGGERAAPRTWEPVEPPDDAQTERLRALGYVE